MIAVEIIDDRRRELFKKIKHVETQLYLYYFLIVCEPEKTLVNTII
jgi:hypothetical protein